MFSTKTFCQMFFELVLKGFKLKKLVVDKKRAQLIELDEEPVDYQLNQSRGAKNLLFLSKWLFNRMRNQLTHTSIGRSPTVTCQTLNANG